MSLEPTDEELAPIKRALEERLENSNHESTPDDQLNILARCYYTVSGLAVNEAKLDAIVSSYITGYERARHLYEVIDDDPSIPF